MTTLLGQYQFNYDRVMRIYEAAKVDQWNAATDIDWSIPITHTQEKREAGAKLLSQFLYGEEASMIVSSRLISEVPHMEARLFLATQAKDEARHTEVFARYLQKVDMIYPINPPLESLLGEILNTDIYEERIVGMNILVEGLALEAFADAKVHSGDPLLASILTYVLRDEARHVGFGVEYLRDQLQDISPALRARLEDTQLRWLTMMYEVIDSERDCANLFGVDIDEVNGRAISDHISRLHKIGLSVTFA